MSIKVMDEVWDIKAGISQGEKLVLLALADCADTETRLCFPSYKYLAEVTLASRATVVRHLAKLERAGLIQRIPTPGTSTRYVVLGGEAQNEPAHSSEPGGGSPVSRGAAHSCEPLTVSEPSKNRRGPLSHFLPKGETLTEARIGMARDLGFGAAEASRQWARLADCEFKTPRSDWDRTWRNWLRGELKSGRNGSGLAHSLRNGQNETPGSERTRYGVDETKQYLERLFGPHHD